MDWTRALSSGGRVYRSSVEVGRTVGVAVELNDGTGGRSGVMWCGGAFSLSVTCDSWLEASPGFAWRWVSSWEGLNERVWNGGGGTVGRGNS